MEGGTRPTHSALSNSPDDAPPQCPPSRPLSGKRSTTIDKILDVLDQPLQRPDDSAYPTERGARVDETCWRCSVRLAAPTPLGACEPCVTDLRSEKPIEPADAVSFEVRFGRSFDEGGPCPCGCEDRAREENARRFVTVDEVHHFDTRTFTEEFSRISLDAFGTRHRRNLRLAINGQEVPVRSATLRFTLPEPNCRFIDEHGEQSRPDEYIPNPQPERVVPIAIETGVITRNEGAAYDLRDGLPRIHCDEYRVVEFVGPVGRPSYVVYQRVGRRTLAG